MIGASGETNSISGEPFILIDREVPFSSFHFWNLRRGYSSVLPVCPEIVGYGSRRMTSPLMRRVKGTPLRLTSKTPRSGVCGNESTDSLADDSSPTVETEATSSSSSYARCGMRSDWAGDAAGVEEYTMGAGAGTGVRVALGIGIPRPSADTCSTFGTGVWTGGTYRAGVPKDEAPA